MTASRPIDRQTFLAYLRQSGLVAEPELSQVTGRLPDTPNGRGVARALVEMGVLTRFQAERLLMGRTSGFLLGQYRILEQLGRGGMGRVFKAEHRTMGRTVALKVLSPELLKTERAVELFLHEVRAVAQLVHPNIVTAYDANEVNGRYYLVLEYVDGPTLDQLVRRQGPLSIGLACDYVRQVAIGLQCAHARGMIHRDIKPANLLVQWHGENGDAPGLVKINDFGLARLATPAATAHPFNSAPGTILTRDNMVMGTPDYLSPEQSRNMHKVDARADLYSLGCTFYFLLTGQVPFHGGSALDKLIRHSTEQAIPLLDLRREVPAPVVAVVQKLMAKHPDDRYQTAAELAAALQPYAVSGPTPWAPSRPPSGLDADSTNANPFQFTDDPDDIVPPSDAEMSALGGTVVNDLSPTPGPPSPARRSNRARGRWPSPAEAPRALGWALGIVAALLAGLAVLALLAGK